MNAIGQTVQLTARVFDQNNNVMNGASLTWQSSMPSVVSVSAQGVVTAVGNGRATITARSGNASATAAVTVSQSAGSIAIEPASATLMSLGETVQFMATVLDGNDQPVADASVMWQSSTPSVVSVSAQGVVTAVSNGRATITARSDRASAIAEVLVMQTPRTVYVEPERVVLTAFGETLQLDATVQDGNGQRVSGAVVTWQTSNPEVAAVSDAGLVTAVANGMAEISARSGDLSGSSEIFVEGPDSDRAFLTAFYDAHDGPNWINAANWNTKTPLDQWYGVSVNVEGRVTALNLASNGLSGVIPAEIGQLAALEGLALDSNRLTGAIPPEIGLLSNLKHLYLFSNQLTGAITPELGNLENLLHMCLDRNRFSGAVPEELGSLTNLKWLHLYENFDLSGPLPVTFTGLVLSEFLLQNTQVCAPTTERFEEWLEGIEDKEVAACTEQPQKNTDRAALVTFYHATGGPGWLDNTNWLSDRSLSQWNGVTIGDNDRVVGLRFWENSLSGSIPAELGRLTNLKRLDISKNNISGSIPAELGQLHNLESLRLYRNNLSGSIPAELGQLQNLKDLDMDGNKLTGSIPAELGQLHNLESLELGSNPGQELNQLSGSIPAELGRLQNLVHLGLRNNQLTGSIPAELGQLHNLEQLSLGGNELTGSIPSELDKLQNLEDLSLDTNLLTGEIPLWVVQLNNLKELGLSQNQLTGEIPPELSRLTKLIYLRLDRNKLTGSIPPELGDLTNLNLLLLSENEALTGPVPVELTNLSNIGRFSMFGTQLCVPTGDLFDDWLRNIPRLGIIGRPEIVVRCDDGTSRDRDALIALYNAAGGQSWNDNTNWLSDQPLNQWFGITTGVSSLVESIELGSNNLTGRLPVELGVLSELRHLTLDGNSGLYGPVPDLSKLNLEALTIDETALCVPSDEDFQAWFQRVSESRVSSCIEPSTEREVLVDFYQTTGGENWRDNSNWLSDKPINEWYGVRTFGDGTVRGLSLRGNNLVGSLPKSLSQLQNAIFLYFTDNQLAGMIPAILSQMRFMRSLQFYGNELTGTIPPEFGHLQNLQHLDLSRNQLTGSIPRELGQLGNLTNLHLDGNQLTGTIPIELGQLQDLERLRLYKNSLSGSIPAELGQLANLSDLLLFDNELAGTIPPELGQLQNLEHLSLSRNQLTGSIPPELGQLSSLTNLRLDGNQLTGSIPPEFGQLRNLSELWLENNKFTGAIPQKLGQLENLTQLNLSVNRLAGEIPTELGNLLHLKYLNISSNPDLCVPQNVEFQAWLSSIEYVVAPAPCPLNVDLSRSSAYLTQSVQSFKYPVPLVADEPALLRVFLTSDGAVANKPAVKATFYHDGVEVHSSIIRSGGVRVPDQIDESSLAISSNVLVPGDLVLPGLGVVVDIGSYGDQLTDFGSMGRIPETGMIEVDVREMPDFDLTIVPLLWREGPDFSVVSQTEGLTAESDLFRLTRDLLPMRDFNLTVRQPVYVTMDPVSSTDRGTLLGEIQAIRTMDGVGGYYMGVWMGGGGLAYQSGVVSLAGLEGDIIAHELGHNLSLGHAPCNKGLSPIDFLDPAFPYVDGNIGAWGLDLLSNALVYPSTSDLMSYCDPVWISDYHFDKMIEYRLTEEEERLLVAGPPLSKILLLWGGLSEDNGLYLEPAFAVDAPPSLPYEGGPYRLAGHDASGNAVFHFDFSMGEIADGEGGVFVFTIPVRQGWSDQLTRITLSGPEGFTEMTRNSGRSAALLLDSSSGQVRGILRDWPSPGMSLPAARRVLPEPGMDIVVSPGIPDPSDW